MFMKNKKRVIMYFSLIIICLFNITGCYNNEERKKWTAEQLANIPEMQANLDDIAQITSDRKEWSRGSGTHYVRDVSIMLKFKMDDKNTVDRNFNPDEIEIIKDLNPDDKPYVNFKFVDIDIVSKDKLYTIERGMYNIIVHLPSNYIVREIDNRHTES